MRSAGYTEVRYLRDATLEQLQQVTIDNEYDFSATLPPLPATPVTTPSSTTRHTLSATPHTTRRRASLQR